MELQITLEEFKLIKQFCSEFNRKPGIESNDYIIGWSELMPVVKRLLDEGLSDRPSDEFVTAVSDFSCGISIVCHIDGVYKEVIKLINLYNTQPKQS